VTHRALRYPTTATLLAVLVVAAIVTETASGRLTSEWLERVGFAPRDLWELELGRLFTSALVTHGPRVLVGALLMTGISVGIAERRAGALWAMGVFWGIHLATVVGMAVVLTPLHATLQSRVTEGLVVVRDVGPSAGYFGALGFGLSASSSKMARLAAVLVLLWLVLNLLGLVHLGDALPQKASADLAHMVAFPLGWLVGRRWLSRERSG
jgi:hypothetical protein